MKNAMQCMNGIMDVYVCMYMCMYACTLDLEMAPVLFYFPLSLSFCEEKGILGNKEMWRAFGELSETSSSSSSSSSSSFLLHFFFFFFFISS
jgi:hypothetical protein